MEGVGYKFHEMDGKTLGPLIDDGEWPPPPTPYLCICSFIVRRECVYYWFWCNAKSMHVKKCTHLQIQNISLPYYKVHIILQQGPKFCIKCCNISHFFTSTFFWLNANLELSLLISRLHNEYVLVLIYGYFYGYCKVILANSCVNHDFFLTMLLKLCPNRVFPNLTSI